MRNLNGLLILPLAALLSACAPPAYQPVTPAADSSLLVVRGEGRVEVAPDQLQLRLGVETAATEADQALTDNNRQMAAVLAQLTELGIGKEEISTGQFQIRPDWSLPPRPTPANWQRQIVGYRVSNELLIKTTRVELAGRLLAVAQAAGANQIGGLQFTLADPEPSRLQAIALATRQAIREAETLAQAAGVKLGAVQSLTLDSSGGTPGPQVMMAEARMASADAVPVESGKVEVKAGVSLVYRLQVAPEPAGGLK